MERVYLDYRHIELAQRKLTLLLGTFDGVHIGHQKLILEARKKTEGDVGVLLFSANPADYFESRKSHSVLTSLEDKMRLFASFGVDVAYVLQIDREFFSLTPEEYVDTVLRKIGPSLIVVGTDYTYGNGAEGNDASLKKSFQVDVVPLLDYEGKKASSQRIMKDLSEGNIPSVSGQLGRDYEIHGKVAHGYEKGRTIGFPTMNLEMETPYALPESGVYSGFVYLRGRPYKSLINVGTNPTVGLLKHVAVECYLSGFEGSAYDETIYVSFHKRIRDEKKFDSLEGLRDQLGKDIKNID